MPQKDVKITEYSFKHQKWVNILCFLMMEGYTAKLLFHQSPTRHSDYHCDDVVTVL